jgi:UDP-3-O-[3-hydroxymyristoyl] N-acetylglucosamine deacetylase/3-hydroxyacyl-[acyl-carrier-protein] dehydratase
MSDLQKTIARTVSLSGSGLHTGRQVTVTFHPAPAGHGYKFRRTDLAGSPVVEALVDYVTGTERGTTLEKDGVRISTTEHLLAAVYGLGIDNVLIEMDGVEVPIVDGSSLPWAELLLEAGIIDQEAERVYYELNANLTYRHPDRKTEMIAIPAEQARYSVMIQFDTKVLDTQHASLENLEDFAKEIAPCRTFVFLHELELLIQHDLIKGGDINNAIVFVDRLVSDEELSRIATFFRKERVDVKPDGVLNNLDLRFYNEPARHKLLDLVGDMALLGARLKAHVIAHRPGHITNVEFTRLIRDRIKEEARQKEQSAPVYDPNRPPLFDIGKIQKLLPHRPPFLLIDKILDMTDSRVVGLKNVTMNESFFVGHFPDEPVMPGVLQIEAMAQTGGILILSTLPDPENYLTYFMKITDVKFRNKVVPGDTVIFNLQLISPIRRGLCHMRGQAWVGNKVVMEAEMLAQIARKPEAVIPAVKT